MEPRRQLDSLDTLDSPSDPVDYAAELRLKDPSRWKRAYHFHRSLTIIFACLVLILLAYGGWSLTKLYLHHKATLTALNANNTTSPKTIVVLPSSNQVLTVNSQLKVNNGTNVTGALGVNGTTTLQSLVVNGDINLSGNLVTAKDGSFAGNVSANNINANQITGNFIGSYSGNGSGLTNVNATTLNNQPASYYLNASNISGQLSDVNLSNNVTLAGNTFNGPSELVQLTSSGILPNLDGSNLSSVDATALQGEDASYFTDADNLVSGTLSDARLSSNVPLLDADNTFTGTTDTFTSITATSLTQNGYAVCDISGNCNTSTDSVTTSGAGTPGTIAMFTGTNTIDNSIITQSGSTVTVSGALAAASLQGDGSAITNLDASNLTTGTVASALLSGSYGGITGVGVLTSGSIDIGFGQISTTNDITTTAALQGETLVTTDAATIGGQLSVVGASTLSSSLTVSGAVTAGNYNGQTISSNASLTGTLAVADDETIGGDLTATGDINGQAIGNNSVLQNLNLQGSTGLTLGITGAVGGQLSFANNVNSNLSTITAIAPSGAGTASYYLPSIAAGTNDTVCLQALGNCGGSGNGVVGRGTANYVAKFTDSGTIGTGLLYDNGSFVGVNLTSSAYTFAVNGSAGATSLYQNGYQVCDTSGNCGYAAETGSGSYINNSTATQAANIDIQSPTTVNPTQVLQDAPSQTADLLDFLNAGGAVIASIDANGNLTAVNGDLTGDLNVNGTSLLGGTLTVNGSTALNDGVTTNNLSVTSNTSLSGTTVISGMANINTAGTSSTNIGNTSGTFSVISPTLTITTAGAMYGITTLGLSGAISGATTGNTINGLIINSGTISAIGANLSGSITQTGSGSLTSGSGAVTLNGATAISGTNTLSVGGTTTLDGALTVISLETLGVAGTTTGLLNFANSANTNLVSFQASTAQVNATTVTIPADSYSTDTLCLQSLENCAAAGTTTGTGTVGYVADFTAAHTLGTGLLYDNGSFVGVNDATTDNGTLSVQGNNATTPTIYLQGAANSTAAGASTLTLQDGTGQTSDLVRVLNASGGVVDRVTTDGRLIIGGGSDSNASFQLYSTNASHVAGAIYGASSQSADLLDLDTSTGTPLAQFDSSGDLLSSSGCISLNSGSTCSAKVAVTTTALGLFINETGSGDIADLESNGLIVAKVDSHGDLTAVSGTFNGATSVTSNNTFTVGTGATILGGTLGVTGMTTLTGGLTVSTITSSGNISLDSAVSGTVSIGTSNATSITVGSSTSSSTSLQGSTVTENLNGTSGVAIAGTSTAYNVATTSSNLFAGFASATSWTTSGSGSSMTAAHTAGSNTAIGLSPTVSIIAGDYYELTYTLSSLTAGTITASLGGVTGFPYTYNQTSTQTFHATSTTGLVFSPDSGGAFVGTISAVSLVQVTPVISSLTVNTSTGVAALEVRNGGIGNANTYVGLQSGVVEQTGQEDSGFGAYALQSDVSGSDDTAVGYKALALNTVGAGNTALGYQAMVADVVGGNDIAIGANALQSNTTASYNLAIGNGALGTVTSSQYNVAIGFQALAGGNPSNDVAIGYQAGYSANSGSDIFIGYQAGYNATGSNLLYVANSNTSTPLIAGNFSTPSITFNGSMTTTGATALQGTTTIGVASSSTGQLKFADASNSNLVTLQSSTLQANATTLTLPADANGNDTVCLQALNNCGGGTITGSGMAGYVAHFTSGSALGIGLLYDNGSTVGVGTTSSTYTFNVNGSAGATSLFQNGYQVCDTSGNCSIGGGGSGSYINNAVAQQTNAEFNTLAASGTVAATIEGASGEDIADFYTNGGSSPAIAINSSGDLIVNSAETIYNNLTDSRSTASNGAYDYSAGLTDSSTSGTTTEGGINLSLIGTATSGTNTLNGINFNNATTATNNNFYGLYFNSGSNGYNSILQVGSNAIISNAGVLQNAGLSTSIQYTNITGVGALTSGSIGTGFGAISTGSNITTTTTLQGATVNATTSFTLNGTNITTAGTLSNFAYLSQANTFTADNTFSGTGFGLTVSNNASVGGTFTATSGVVAGVSTATTGKLEVGTGAAIGEIINQTGSFDQLDFQNNGTTVAKFNQNGQLTLGTIATSGTVSQGLLAFADGTTDGYGVSLKTATQANNVAVSIPTDGNGTDTVCLQTLANCTAGNYILNTTSVQSAANIDIAATSGVAITTKGASGQDIADFLASGGSTPVAKIDQNGNLTAVQGNFSQSSSTNVVSALNVTETNAYTGSGSFTQYGETINLNGTANSSGYDYLVGLSLPTISSTPTHNGFTAIQVGSNYTGGILNYGSTVLIDQNGHIQNAGLSSSIQYTNITGVGPLTSGSIGTGFGAISTGSNITTTATLQGGAVVATGSGTGLSVTNNASIGGSLSVGGVPTAVATASLLQVGGTALVGGNSASNGGTYLGINEPSSGAGSAADFVNFENGNTSELDIAANGQLTDQGGITTSGSLTTNTTLGFNGSSGLITEDNNGDTLTVQTTNAALNLKSNGYGGLTVNANGSTTVQDGSNSTTAFQIQNSNGDSVLDVDTSSDALTLGNITTVSGHAIAGQLVLADGTTDGYGVTLKAATQTNNVALSIPTDANSSDIVCLQTLGNCTAAGSTTSTGTSNYVARFVGSSTLGTGLLYDNGSFAGVNTTSANGGTFSIQATSGAAGLVVQGTSGDDIADFDDSTGTTMAYIDASGDFYDLSGITGYDGIVSSRAGSNNSGFNATVTNSNVSSSSSVVNGYSVSLTGTANTTSNTNTLNGINLGGVTLPLPNNNTFNGIYVGTNYSSILNYDGTSLIDGNGYLQNAALNSSINYSNLQNITNLTATGGITATSGAINGTLTVHATNTNTTGSTVADTGESVQLTGTANTLGSNVLNGLAFANVTPAANNSFNAITVGSNYSTILTANGVTLINGSGTLQNAALGSSVQYTNITGVGPLTSGSIGTGFGAISTGNNITTTASLQGATLNVTSAVEINGTTVLQAPGTANIYTGQFAGNISGSGSNNTATGYTALESLSSGSYNAGYGSASLTALTTGTNDSAFGSDSLQAATSAGYDTALGYSSLHGLLSGSYDTAIGDNSGYTNSSGSDNTYIGYDAGYTNTGSGNVFIGYQAGYNESNSNKLYIANSSTATPLIYGDFSASTLNFNGAITASGSASLQGTTTIGIAGGSTGQLAFANSNNANLVTLEASTLQANATVITLPADSNSTDTVCLETLKNCGSGVSGVTTIGTLDGGTANSNGASISSTTLYLQSASTSNPGLVNTTTQNFTGAKTFSAAVTDSSTLTANGVSVFKDTTSSTTAFQVQNATGTTALLDIDSTNDRVGIGTSTPNNALSVVGNIAASGTITGGVGSPDYAEEITATDPTISAGDLVAIDPNNPEQVVKTNEDYDPELLGVISTDPGFITNADISTVDGGTPDGSQRPLALAGRVPVNVTGENGPIEPGDYLTASDTPGYAMRATAAGPVVGIAMTAFGGTDSSDTGSVIVYIATSYYDPTSATGLQGSNPTVDSLTVNGAVAADSINIGGLATVGSLQVSGSAAIAGNLQLGGDLVVRSTDNSTTAIQVVDADGNVAFTVDAADHRVGINTGTNGPSTNLSVNGGNNINPSYPDGLAGTVLTQALSQATSYTVPTGKTLYITNATGALSVNNVNLYLDTGAINQPLIVGAGSTITTTAVSAGINGLLVNSGVTVLTQALSQATSYTVPTGKTLYITNATGALSVNNVNLYLDTGAINQPLIVGAGSTITTTAVSAGINGYLTNANGFGGP